MVAGTVRILRLVPLVVLAGRNQPRAFCVLSSHDRMICTTDGGENWVERAVRGLAEPCLKGVASQMMLPVHQQIWLLAGADGSLYRSIGDSGNWTRVLAPGSGARRLVRLGTSPEVVCAVSHREVQCSENGGFEFFPVGLGYEQNASSGQPLLIDAHPGVRGPDPPIDARADPRTSEQFRLL